MKPAPHPRHSPDLARLNFYLFGDVKGRLAGLLFQNADELLRVMFLETMNRLGKWIDSNGEHSDETQDHSLGRKPFIRPRVICLRLHGTPDILRVHYTAPSAIFVA
jgi:hypothetical protein